MTGCHLLPPFLACVLWSIWPFPWATPSVNYSPALSPAPGFICIHQCSKRNFLCRIRVFVMFLRGIPGGTRPPVHRLTFFGLEGSVLGLLSGPVKVVNFVCSVVLRFARCFEVRLSRSLGFKVRIGGL
uniref:Secreted protein n=1 Tax=Opuntia streptacantha TaxID=393608 RepID=A0A7C8YVU8_OPUST